MKKKKITAKLKHKPTQKLVRVSVSFNTGTKTHPNKKRELFRKRKHKAKGGDFFALPISA